MSDAFDTWLKNRTPAAEASHLLPLGAEVGDYRVVLFIGRGGSGEVYSVIHRTLGTRAALKILHKNESTARERFRREAQLLSECLFPFFPRFIAYGEHEGHPYLIEELLSVRELPSSDRGVAAFVVRIAQAVGALHARGIIHRDIKPDNILWRSAAEPVLTDLGLSYMVGPARRRGPHHPLSIHDGHPVAVGTPGYAAPEQLTGGKIDVATDIHALGVLIDACFDGHPPRVWSRIIRRATSSLVAQRYGSAESLIRAVAHRHRVRNMTVGFLSAVVFALIVAAAVVFGGNAWWDYQMKQAGRIYPQDRSFSILPIDETPLMPLDELGIAGWGMGEEGDAPIVLVQKLSYNGDFAEHRELQRRVGETYGGKTTTCVDEVTNQVLRVEIDGWREGENELYLYRKLYVAGSQIYQVTGQTQMRTKARDRDKIKRSVDSFQLR